MTAAQLLRIWRGDVRRWHANPDHRLRDSGDTIHAHQWRVAALILHMNPTPSPDLIRAALLHDVAETITGDVPWGQPKVPGTEAGARNHLGVATVDLTAADRDWLHFADRLDALLWARERGAADTPEWHEQRKWLRGEFVRLGVMEMEGMVE